MSYDFEREIGFAERQEARELTSEHIPQCPNCQSWEVDTVMANAKLHGYDRDMPFHECLRCGFEYTDYCFEIAAGRAR